MKYRWLTRVNTKTWEVSDLIGDASNKTANTDEHWKACTDALDLNPCALNNCIWVCVEMDEDDAYPF